VRADDELLDATDFKGSASPDGTRSAIAATMVRGLFRSRI
jgi:hypothetical protein